MVKGNASKTPFLFNGMYGVMTDENGLLYMRARFYSSEIRKFVNRDVLLGGVADGQTLNRFAFVEGQPVKLVDPFGLLVTPETAFDVVSLGLSIAEFNSNPNFLNGLGVAIDMLGTLVPIIPAGVGIIRQCNKLPTTRKELHKDLLDKGYEFKGISNIEGYTRYKGPDGKTITIKPTGEVIPTQRVWNSEGTKKFPQRQDYNGNPIIDQSHSTEHFVDPIIGPFKGNN